MVVQQDMEKKKLNIVNFWWNSEAEIEMSSRSVHELSTYK